MKGVREERRRHSTDCSKKREVKRDMPYSHRMQERERETETERERQRQRERDGRSRVCSEEDDTTHTHTHTHIQSIRVDSSIQQCH